MCFVERCCCGEGEENTQRAPHTHERPTQTKTNTQQKQSWGVFRDRRPELYQPLVTLDGARTHDAHRRGAAK